MQKKVSQINMISQAYSTVQRVPIVMPQQPRARVFEVLINISAVWTRPAIMSMQRKVMVIAQTAAGEETQMKLPAKAHALITLGKLPRKSVAGMSVDIYSQPSDHLPRQCPCHLKNWPSMKPQALKKSMNPERSHALALGVQAR
jgi:hypothetical protein